MKLVIELDKIVGLLIFLDKLADVAGLPLIMPRVGIYMKVVDDEFKLWLINEVCLLSDYANLKFFLILEALILGRSNKPFSLKISPDITWYWRLEEIGDCLIWENEPMLWFISKLLIIIIILFIK